MSRTVRRQADELRDQAGQLEEMAQTLRDLADAVEAVDDILATLDLGREADVVPPTRCESCGVSYGDCSRMIQRRTATRKPCCRECAEYDTHGLGAAGLL